MRSDRYLFDNTKNEIYIIDKNDSCRAIKVNKCNRMSVDLRNLSDSDPPIYQNLPELSSNEEYAESVNYLYENNDFDSKNLDNYSNYEIQRMRAYRIFLMSEKNKDDCDEISKNNIKNNLYINKTNYEQIYKKINETTYKIYNFINGKYCYKNNLIIPKNTTIQNYLNRNNKKITKKTINRYNGNKLLFNHYEYCNGRWILIKVDLL